MKKYFFISVLSVLMLSMTTTLYADQWVDIGPSRMSISDFKVLQQMVEGESLPQKVIPSGKPDLVNVGVADIPRDDFLMIAGLVNGEVKRDNYSVPPKEKFIDLGVVTLKQSDMQTLSGMVQKGLLQHWYAKTQLDVATH